MKGAHGVRVSHSGSQNVVAERKVGRHDEGGLSGEGPVYFSRLGEVLGLRESANPAVFEFDLGGR